MYLHVLFGYGETLTLDWLFTSMCLYVCNITNVLLVVIVGTFTNITEKNFRTTIFRHENVTSDILLTWKEVEISVVL